MPKKKKKSKIKKRRKKTPKKSSKKRKVTRRKSKPKKKSSKETIKTDNKSSELIFKTKPEWIKSGLTNKAQYQKKYNESIKNNNSLLSPAPGASWPSPQRTRSPRNQFMPFGRCAFPPSL